MAVHPNPGWQPQQPQPGYGPPQPGYGPPQPAQGQPGYGPPAPGYGPPGPGYGPPGWGQPRKPSTALAYIVGSLWVLVSVLCFVLAALNSDKGVRQTPEAAVALIGMGLPRSVIGNGDAVIAATYTAGGIVLLLAGLLFARLGFARWILTALGFVVFGYYVYAVIYLAVHGAGTMIIMPVVALLLWLVAVVMSVLPATGRAMR